MRRQLLQQHCCFLHCSFCSGKRTAAGANIKLWTYPIGGWGKDETVQSLSRFNAKYPDIKVTVEYLDYTNGDDQVNTAIEGGSAPDLIMEGPEHTRPTGARRALWLP